MKAIVFDIGNVLIHWDPRPAFRMAFDGDADVDTFLERTGFFTRNLRADRGERFAALAQEIDDDADRILFSTYPDRFALTVREPIEGTWQVVNSLKRRGYSVHAMTNWSLETWPIGLTMHPRLQDTFDTTIVSGQVRITKPDKAIFELFHRRTGIAAEDCLMIDDDPLNVDGARAAGWQTHLFTTPAGLAEELTYRGLL
ncbi:MAG: HAD family phosphatase [Roseobacter sp.]|jgi:FMN phosphatase YigB (HAD superfamily)